MFLAKGSFRDLRPHKRLQSREHAVRHQNPKPQAHQNLPNHSQIREIFMPALSSTVTGTSVVVVESDKAYMDVETYDGILAANDVPEGETSSSAVRSTYYPKPTRKLSSLRLRLL
ncbi:hypothetical protein Nepgr_003721 [Nepenthes gracilis]|uniref:Uncharacterized protein n=1 Tax=Nepenthes gracilis TaxID=150966 RepID=A0AAD3S044_NEPGR|nr:hypothetical protein Nepgr_003721 [Nepenthes gracilis]